MIFDTHAHFLDHRFDPDREELINSLKPNGIKNVTEVSASREDFEKVIDHINKYDMFYGTLGVHPSETESLTKADMETMKTLSKHEKIVAIGEIGLDYHYDDAPKPSIQKKWFVRQLEVAKEVCLPVVIHSRDAAEETYEILKDADMSANGGVIHCFSYSLEMAWKFLDLGYYIGIDGPVTFKNSRKAKEVVKSIPADRLVVETDCPYMAPEPLRGSRNSSLNLKYIVAEIASLRGISCEEAEAVLYENAKRLYGKCRI